MKLLTQFSQKAGSSCRSGGRVALVVSMALWAVACATNPAPVEQMAAAQRAVSQAATAGGNEFAPLQMQAARDHLMRAQAAMTASEFDLARKLSQEAGVDAQLAESKVRSAKAQQAAVELREDRRVLEGEIQRNKN